MARECVYVDETEDCSRELVVCHHCGRPMCTTHGRLIEDDVFSISETAGPARAMHCWNCKAQYHARAEEITFRGQVVSGPAAWN